MTTLELIKTFLEAYFVEHKPEKGFDLVTDDVQCYGFADDRELSGKEELKEMAASSLHRRFMSSELKIEKENQVSEDSAVLDYSLSLNSITIRGRICGNSRQTTNGNQLYLMVNTMLNPLQTLHVYEDVARGNRIERARELLGSYISGGMMGGYIGPGFPFYFINDNMLRYLGYESEAEFIEDTNGLIENCIYEDDREKVKNLVKNQVAATGEYSVDYRMLKKDKGYMWVHDVGKKIVAEDGRDAILSACYDITSEKEYEHFLEGLMNSLNADLAIFAVNLKEHKTIPVYTSENIRIQWSVDKVESLNQNDGHGMSFVYREDRQRVWDTICDVIENHGTPSISFRMIDQSNKPKWVNASFSKYGEKDGMPELLALLTASTIQNELQLHVLNQNGTGITVIDADTNEVYYVNDAMFHMLGEEPCDYKNKLCSEILTSCGGSCENCKMKGIQEIKSYDQIVEVNGKWLLFRGELREWAGKSVVSIYVTDETEKYRLQYQMENVFDNMPSAVCLYRWDGKNLDRILIGSGFKSIFGSGAKKLIDSSQNIIFEIVHPEDKKNVQNRVLSFLNSGGNGKSSCQYRAWNEDEGKYIWVSLYANKVKQSDGSYFVYAVFTNDTEQIALKNQLIATRTAINAAVQYGQIGLWTYDLTTGIILQSMTDEGSYGYDRSAEYSPELFVSKKVVHEEDAEVYLNCYKSIHDGAKNSDCVVRIFDIKRKEYRWMHIYLVLQMNGNHMNPKAIGMSFDINQEITNYDQLSNAQKQLKQEKQLLEKTCRLAHIWMFNYNLQDKKIRLSKGLQEDYNVPKIVGNFPDGFLEYPVIPKENHELYRQMVKKVDAGEDATTEMQVQMPDGSRRFVRFEWHITRQENGKPVEVTGLSVDITNEIVKRRRIENERQKLLGGDKKLTAYSITDLKKEIIIEAEDFYLNSGIKVGDTCTEFDDKILPYLLTDEDRRRFLEMRDPKYSIEKYEAGVLEWSEDMRWKNEKGHVRWQRSVYSVVDNKGTGSLHLYCYLYDVMEEKMVHALFSGIQKNLYIKTGVLSFTTEQLYAFEGVFPNRSLTVTDYNVARKEYASNYVIPEDIPMVMEKNTIESMKKNLASGELDYSFSHRTMKDGKLCYYQVRYALVPGDLELCIFVVRDITDLVNESEKKNTELKKALIEAEEASKAKSEFLSRMSHEIRTPMNAIIGMTDVAQDNKSDFLQVSDCLDKIDSSSKYLLTLINDILEMSRIESGKMKLSEEEFGFAQLIDEINAVVAPLANKSDIRFDIFNKTKNQMYYGDHIRVQQILINLIGNAIKFTKPLGRVRFAVSVVKETSTETTFEFMVEDTGIGMSEKFMEHMFEPFSQEDSTTTSEYGGSGLGLAISKNLLDAMGGTIAVESMLGIGSNFTVQIPLKKIQSRSVLSIEKAEEMTEAEMDKILKDKKILMAEDHPMNIMVAKKLLERKGLVVTVAENGKIAVDLFRKSALNEYDAILMDIRMPIMDGIEATRQIRSMDRADASTIPILAMTANALEEDRKQSKNVGMNVHLSKPIEPKKMYQAIAKQVVRRNV